MNLKQMEQYVIEPALKAVDLYSPEVARLLLYTGYVESRYEYVAQVGGGPARSFWQVEPTTMYDHYEQYLHFRIDLVEKVNSLFGGGDMGKRLINHDDCQILNFQLTTNMAFAVVIARLVYRRKPTPIPAIDDLEGQARIWKADYNSHLGKGTEEKFIELCRPLQQELP